MDSLTVLSIVIPILVIVAFLIIRTLRVIPEYQRGISFRFGHLRSELKPGINLVVPLIDSLQRVDMRVITLTIPPQEVITKDNVPARVNAVVLFRVISAKDAVLEVENYPIATSQIAQTTLRSLLGRVDLDTLLAHRDDLNADLQSAQWLVRLRLSVNAAPRSFRHVVSLRLHLNLRRLLTFSVIHRLRYSCGICRLFWSWALIRIRRLFSRFRWILWGRLWGL